MVKLHTNLTVSDIEVNDNLNQYSLKLKQPSLFSPEGIEISLTLWSRRDRNLSPDDVERTQAELRKQLDDENIIFTDPTQATDDPNHIVNWVKTHVGHPVKQVYENDNGYYNLGEPRGGGRSLVKFLENYDPQKHGGYDPLRHRVQVYDAWSNETIEQFENQNGPNIHQSKKGYKTLYHMGIITDIILDDANDFDQRNNLEKVTRKELREEVLKELEGVDAFEKIVKEIEALPEEFSYASLVKILGGRECSNLEANSRKMRYISSILDSADRTTIAFYVQNEETGRIFRTSKLRLPRLGYMYTFSFGFEFLTDDFAKVDFMDFLKTLFQQQIGLDEPTVLKALAKVDLFKEDPTPSIEINDKADLMTALRAIFQGYRVNVGSGIGTSSTVVDKARLGSRIERILDYVGDVEISNQKPITTPEVKVETEEKPEEETMTSPFDAVEEEESTDLDNPFNK